MQTSSKGLGQHSGLAGGCGTRRGRAGHRGAGQRGDHQRAMGGDRRRLRVSHRLSVLQPIHRQERLPAGPHAHDAGVEAQRWPGLRAHQQARAVRSPFRRHCRRRPAGGTGAGRTDGLPARHALADCRRGAGRCGAGLHDPVHLHAPRRALAGGSDQVRTGHGARCDCVVWRLHDHGYHPGRAGADCGQGPDQLTVGHLHGGSDDPHRAPDGRVHALHPPGQDRRGLHHRLRGPDGRHHLRPGRGRASGDRPDVRLRRQGPDLDADRLRLRRRRAAGVAAAGPA